jgi:hypothetical protein
MPAGYQDIYLEQGTDFNRTITLADNTGNSYNLYGFSVSSQSRLSYYSQNTAIYLNSSITDAANGVITISASSANTANIQYGISKLVYDVIITDTFGTKTRVLEGVIYISPSVTQ